MRDPGARGGGEGNSPAPGAADAARLYFVTDLFAAVPARAFVVEFVTFLPFRVRLGRLGITCRQGMGDGNGRLRRAAPFPASAFDRIFPAALTHGFHLEIPLE